MAGTNGQWKQILAGAAVVVVTAVLLLGLNGSVQTLQTKVAENRQSVDLLGDQIDAIGNQLDELRAEAKELGSFRADILQAICAANAKSRADLRRCLDRSG